MKKLCLALSFFALLAINAAAQDKFYTKTGKITFFSSTSLEDIQAINKSVTALLNATNGDIQISMLMKGFEFKKALMQEHFNEDYIESDKFPKAGFKGQITNNSSINYAVNGSYPATVSGQLTI